MNAEYNDVINAASKRDEVLSKVAMAAIVEQRKSRRWGMLWKILTFLYLTFIVLALFGLMSAGKSLGSKPTASVSGKFTAVVDLNGVIASDAANADMIINGLQAAFDHKGTSGVVLRINSPGGSPVQSAQIYDEMLRLRAKYPGIPLHAVIDDIGASGGYFVAAGAEKIFANRASLVGSIGVIMQGFGFVEAMEKLGVESRVLTAGENKALADPFSEEDPKATAHLKQMLSEVHAQFIQAVKDGRGDRLQANDDIFSGLIWTAEKGVELGLVDELSDIRSIARDEIGEEELVNFTPNPDILEKFASRLGASISHNISTMFSNNTLR